jgi:hypothetical protein
MVKIDQLKAKLSQILWRGISSRLLQIDETVWHACNVINPLAKKNVIGQKVTQS